MDVDMKMILIAALAVASMPALAGNLKNKDVRAFKENAELCEHYAGEWDSELPDVQRRSIEAGIDASCSKAQTQAKALKRRYRHDKEVMRLINQYDSVKSFQAEQ
jgi:hypothetical protein